MWNVCNGYDECMCRAWRLESWRPTCMGSECVITISVLKSVVVCLYMMIDELIKRLLTFTQKCYCDNKLVNFMVTYPVWYGRMKSPLGCGVFLCCSRNDFIKSLIPKKRSMFFIKLVIFMMEL